MPVARVGGVLPSIDAGPGDGLSPSAVAINRYPLPSAPGLLDTYIEAPYALYLSPTVYVGSSPLLGFASSFENQVNPATSPKKVTEVFTSTLQRNSGLIIDFLGSSAQQPQVSAIWCRDYTQGSDVTPEEFIYYGQVVT
jgi:hypothetical protein